MSEKGFHPRNKHTGRYDFTALTAGTPELSSYMKTNPKGELTIDFHDPEAVKLLNKALLKQHYGINHWDIPPGYLCPPIPGRADYLHHIADLSATVNGGKIPKSKQIKCFDVGVGANCIYPVIGSRTYGWTFIGSDIDEKAIQAAQKIIDENSILNTKIELRLQSNPEAIFKGVLSPDERIDFTICNPPFHASAAEAAKGTQRKLNNLRSVNAKKKAKEEILNFGGQSRELWCEGGERKFIQNIIRESADFALNCFWFSALVSKEKNLKPVYAALKKAAAFEVKTIPIQHGNKRSRIVAWTFLKKKQQAIWRQMRWS